MGAVEIGVNTRVRFLGETGRERRKRWGRMSFEYGANPAWVDLVRCFVRR
jgi:hypothetical protein